MRYWSLIPGDLFWKFSALYSNRLRSDRKETLGLTVLWELGISLFRAKLIIYHQERCITNLDLHIGNIE